MAPRLSPADIGRIAELARLELTPAEGARLADELSRILEFASAVQTADTSDVPPDAPVVPLAPRWRDDVVVPSLDRPTVLAEAPDAVLEAGLFGVPRVL
jgi:aspartyl-tRNA(Asn)/glutamyl-tRNA(Gln) amidotransferase subunit C